MSDSFNQPGLCEVLMDCGNCKAVCTMDVSAPASDVKTSFIDEYIKTRHPHSPASLKMDITEQVKQLNKEIDALHKLSEVILHQAVQRKLKLLLLIKGNRK